MNAASVQGIFSNSWGPFLGFVLNYLPSLLIFLTGLILCVVSWKKHPRASLVGLFSFLIFLSSSCFEMFFQLSRFYMLLERKISPSEYGQNWATIGLILQGLRIGAWVLLLVAFFGWRNKSSSQDLK